MILPLRTGLTSARRWLAGGLAGSRELESIEALALHLPDVMSAMGFEFRLAGADSRIDFGTVIYAGDAGRWILGRSIGDEQATNQSPVWPASWDRPRSFFRRWCDPASPLHDGVARLFFEFDTSAAGSAPLVPCLFVTLDEMAWSRDSLSVLPIVDEALRLLAGEERAVEESALVRLCVKSLPSGSLFLHIGAMLARPDCPIRFCGWISPGLLPDYLETIHAPIDLQLVKEFCELQSAAITFQLTLVRGEIAPRLDIEWHFRRQPRAEPRWEELLRAMMQRNICSREKCKAILEWPGLALEMMGSSTGRLVTRAVSHVKVSLGGDRAVAGKAYLTLAPTRSLRALD